MNWDDHRDASGSINLVTAFRDQYPGANCPTSYLEEVMAIQPIRSRQVAATALATGRHLAHVIVYRD